MPAKPLYVAADQGPARDACVQLLDGSVQVLDREGIAEALGTHPPGILVLDPEGMNAADLVSLGEKVAGTDWVIALFRDGDEPSLRALSIGYAEGPEDVVSHAADPESAPERLLELHRVLADVARARHDINNPLTSALAETQILLLDVEEGEIRDSLEVVQEQLRRIRDLVAGTRHIRPRS